MLAVDEGYAGIEALSGIPGLVGAGPIQNVGAYGQEVAQTVGWVRALDRTHRRGRAARRRRSAGSPTATACSSASSRYVVLAVAFALEHSRLGAPVRYAELAGRLGVEVGDRVPAADVRAAVLELRRGKGMVLDAGDHDTWSAGSFFTNPLLTARGRQPGCPTAAPRWPAADGRVKASAAWLIEQAGFGKGYGDRARPGSPPSTPSRSPTAAAPPPPTCWRWPARSGPGCCERFGVALQNEPDLVGVEL